MGERPKQRARSDGDRRLGKEWWLLAAAAAGAFALGCVGLGRAGGSDLTWSDTAYRSLQLFTLESGAVEPGTASLWLDIARFAAPVVTVWAAVRAVVALFRDELALLSVRYRAKDHTVIAGLGTMGFALAQSLTDAGRRVVVIENDAANPFLAGCRERAIPVVVGDATDPAQLRRARTERASHVAVLCGTNRDNIDIAFSAARASAKGSSSPATIVAHIDDVALWRVLAGRLLAAPERLPARIELFNLHHTAAGMLLERHPPDGRTGTVDVLVVGAGPLAESMLVHIAAADRPGGVRSADRPAVTLLGPEASRQLDTIATRCPGLARHLSLRAIDAELAELATRGARGWDARRAPFSAIYVCLDEEAAGLAAALAMADNPRGGRSPVVLAVEDDRVGVAGAIDADRMTSLHTFAFVTGVLTPDLFRHGTTEVLARAKHEQYVRCELQRPGAGVSDNPSMRPWADLDERFRESNRMFADSIGAKLHAAGCAIVPLWHDALDEPPFRFGEAEVEQLAVVEHDRWCQDLLDQGWRWGPVKDPTGDPPCHPALVPWDELPEAERDKDREAVRAVPDLLAMVGFEIRRVQRPPTEGAGSTV